MLDVDAVVIGSGAGGLAAAVALAQAGKSVTLLEQHYVPGGFCHSFQLGGFRFSPGVHYLGQLNEGGGFRRLLEGLGVSEHLSFFQLNPDGFDHCQLGAERFDYCAGVENLSARLKARFPADARGIDRYLSLVLGVRDELSGLSEMKGLEFLLMPFKAPRLMTVGFASLEAVLRRRIKDPLCRAVLSAPCGDHGLGPKDAPMALHAGVVSHYLDGGWYPRGGGSAIPKAFTRAFAKAGGTLRLEAPVERILLEKDQGRQRAVGVRLSDGTQLRARHVISNADPSMTFGRLVGLDALSSGLRKKLARTRYSVSSLSLFCAVEMDLRALGYDSGNYWYSSGLEPHAAYQALSEGAALTAEELPGLFVSITTLKDPTHYDGRHHIVEAFTFAPYSAFEPYQGEKSLDRNAGYQQLKEQLKAKMLRALEKVIPGATARMVFSDLATPLTNVHYVRATAGAMYGTEKRIDQLGPRGFSNLTEIRGLRLCGASTLAHGVQGSMVSGLTCAAGILDCRPSELLQQKGPPLQTYLADDPATWPDAVKAIAARTGRTAEARGS